MDAELMGALTAANVENHHTQAWFDLVTETYQYQVEMGAADDWDGFAQRITDVAGGDFAVATESFLAHAESHGKLDLVTNLVAIGPILPDEYVTATAGAAPDGSSSWARVVELFGPGWVEWDGSEAGWVQFRDWLYSGANGQDPEMYAAAYEQLDPLNSAPLAERVARLSNFGFTVTAAGHGAEGGGQDESAQSLDDVISSSLDEAVAEIPGAEVLSPADLAEIRAEIAAELAST